MPPLLATRETAVARWRRSGGTRDASRADWLGSRAPFPAPAAAAAMNACEGACVLVTDGGGVKRRLSTRLLPPAQRPIHRGP